MYSELIKRCKAGDQIACRQFLILHALVPRVERLFQRLRTESDLIVLPRPRPPHDTQDLEQLLRDRHRFDQLLQSEISEKDLPSTPLLLQTLREIRRELRHLLDEIDGEIRGLEV